MRGGARPAPAAVAFGFIGVGLLAGLLVICVDDYGAGLPAAVVFSPRHSQDDPAEAAKITESVPGYPGFAPDNNYSPKTLGGDTIFDEARAHEHPAHTTLIHYPLRRSA